MMALKKVRDTNQDTLQATINIKRSGSESNLCTSRRTELQTLLSSDRLAAKVNSPKEQASQDQLGNVECVTDECVTPPAPSMAPLHWPLIRAAQLPSAHWPTVEGCIWSWVCMKYNKCEYEEGCC